MEPGWPCNLGVYEAQNPMMYDRRVLTEQTLALDVRAVSFAYLADELIFQNPSNFFPPHKRGADSPVPTWKLSKCTNNIV